MYNGDAARSMQDPSFNCTRGFDKEFWFNRMILAAWPSLKMTRLF